MLHFEEISSLVDVFAGLGVDRVRLTGGEPLLRHDLPTLVRLLAAKPAIRDLALTTNGLLLAEQAASLARAGLHRLTVSLDTLQPERFRALTRRDGLDQVLAGIEAALRAGFAGIKIDTVVMRGTNDDELVALIEYARPLRPGGALHRVHGRRRSDALGDDGRRAPRRDPGPTSASATARSSRCGRRRSAPADRYRLPDGTVFGIIASTTAPFCRSCDRARLTADGMWYLCLYARLGVDLRGALRGGASPRQIEDIIAGRWRGRDDRGAERRLERRDRAPLLQVPDLRQDPHLEMHTRGG